RTWLAFEHHSNFINTFSCEKLLPELLFFFGSPRRISFSMLLSKLIQRGSSHNDGFLFFPLCCQIFLVARQKLMTILLIFLFSHSLNLSHLFGRLWQTLTHFMPDTTMKGGIRRTLLLFRNFLSQLSQ